MSDDQIRRDDPIQARKLDMSELDFDPIELGPNEVPAGAVLIFRSLFMTDEGNAVRMVTRATSDMDFIIIRGMAEEFRDIVKRASPMRDEKEEGEDYGT